MSYPQQITQAWLHNQVKPEDERLVRVELRGLYNYRPVPFYGKKNKRYIFTYDPKTSCHALEVPESLWMESNGAFARDLMLQPFNKHQLVALILPISKQAEKPAPKPLPKKQVKTTTKTAEESAMAVLGG